MKMTKLLAIGSAAAVAVASLASVASAAEQTFDMGITKGTIKLSGSKGKELAGYVVQTEDVKLGKNLGISADSTMVLALKYDAADSISDVTLEVTGIKGDRSGSSKTYKYAFNKAYGTIKTGTTATPWSDVQINSTKYIDVSDDGAGAKTYYYLTAYAGTSDLDTFIPAQYTEISKIELKVNGELTTDDQKYFNKITTEDYGLWDEATLDVVFPFNADASLNNPCGDVTDVIEGCATDMWGFKAGETSTTADYPFMAVTDNGDKTLTRQEIELLSYAGAWNATNKDYKTDRDQSYDENGLGDRPYQFAGLASQVADFFNKQTNGTITFKFTAATATSSSTWATGGIPSTQVGIKNALGNATANDFAMFFNYDQTGSLEAIASIDKDAGEVTFDISDILDELGGQTKGVIDNIYYGLTTGVYYDDIKATGLKVETVTLAYDEEDDADIVDEDDDIEDDDDDIDDVEVDDDDDDDDIDDDDDDVTVDDDDDDDDTADDADDTSDDVAGDVIVNKPADDSNPHTGVALAVVPAAIAAAAVVVSKKRK